MDNRVHYKDCSRYNWHDPEAQCDGARCHPADPEADAIDLRYCLGACLLGHTLGDGNGVDVMRVANILVRELPSMGWTFTRIDGGDDVR